MARSRSGFALGGAPGAAWAIAVCSPTQQRDRPRRSKSFVFIAKNTVGLK